MKNMFIGVFVVILAAAFIQPLIEVSNALKEKVTLGAAILNSCRAARNNALVSVSYYDSDRNMGDLNAYISEAEFRRFFAEAFSETLGVGVIDPGADPMRFEANNRWNAITVEVQLEYDGSGDFENRGKSIVTVAAVTPYVFRTSLLQEASDASRVVYNITETRVFTVQVIN